MHYSESPKALSTVNDYIKQYMDKEVYKYGISFEAYMNMPADVAKEILSEIDAKAKADSKVASDILGAK